MAQKVPIVTQLLMEASDPNISIASLLRKAKIIAAKLNLSDFLEWINNELNGYACKARDLPEYRKGHGDPVAFNPYRGWQPIIFENANTRKIYSSVYIAQAIGPLEELINESKNSKNGRGTFAHSYPNETKHKLIASLDAEDVHIEVPKGFIHGILEAIRNSILDWSLKLDGAGILGEDLIFSETEKEEARPVTQQIFAQNIGQIGNVYDEAKVINTQTAFAQYDSKQIAALVEQIEKTIEFLPSDQKEPVHGHIQEIKAEIVKPDIQQDRPKITRALHSIKCVCEGAMGNVVAQGIISLISNLPNIL